MKKLKKFKRYAEGGALGAGEGDPFSYTDFSDRARSLRKPSEAAPIDRSRDVETASVKPPKITESRLPESVKPEKETKAEEKEPVKESGPASFDYEPQRPYNQALEDAKEQGRRARDAFKPAKPAAVKPAAPKPEKDVKYSGDAINVSSGASGFPMTPSPSDREAKNKAEIERLKKEGSGAVEQTMEGPLEAGLFGLMGGIPSKVRAGIGLAKKAYNEFTKPEPKAAPKTEPKLESKPEPKQGQLFDEAGQPTPAALGKPAPKEAPKAEPKAETKSGAIQPTGKGPSEAGRKAMEGSKGSLKDQAKDAINKQRAADKDPRGALSTETKSGAIQPTGKGPSEAGRKLMQESGRGKPQTMKEKAIEEVNASRAATKDSRGPVSETKGTIKPTYKGPSQAGREMMENAGKGKATGPQRSSLKDQAIDAINKQRASDKDSRGPLMEGSRPARPEPKPIKPTGAGPSEAGRKLMERTNNRSSTILEHERNPNLAMQEYISGRDAARTRARDLPDDGLSTTRYANKKGGKIPAFKKGGLVSRGDGCAQRGKTKGRMV